MLRRRNAFTLVELLVVIGIIALLISILLPALNRAREQARQVSCASNERQVFMAVTNYANENRGILPIPSTKGQTTQTPLTVCWLMSAVGVADYTQGTFWPYLAPSPYARKGVMNCPDDIDAVSTVLNNGTTNLVTRNFSYTFNCYLAPPPSTPGFPVAGFTGVKVSQIRHPADRIFICEELSPNDAYSILGANQDDRPGNRHNGNANYGFGDGHVECLSPEDLGLSSTSTAVTNAVLQQHYFDLFQELK
jgi:prepilin-type processing-associated H-X9-DG protein/prepilin-type N-terminal cleavage/methylation domain-containing protein